MGLPADKADEYGSTALHLAAAQGASAVVEYMIENVTEAEVRRARNSAQLLRNSLRRHLPSLRASTISRTRRGARRWR